ncbi:MAG: hypothetical protein R2752_12110 [Vicinamibacterales bacterium]
MAKPSPDLEALGFGHELDDVLRGAHPNPTREGCPPREVLIALSRRQRAIDDPTWDHLLECSPCYAEVRHMQRAHVIASRYAARWRWWMAAAAAAAVVVIAAGVWWIVATRGTPPLAPSPSAPRQVTLDLRPYSVTRSVETPDSPPPLELPRSSVELTLLLPVGSEPGRYDVQLLDAKRRSVASAQGEAAIREFVTTLPVNVDLGDVAPGDYELAVRREGDGWRMFPTVVR